MATNTQLKFYKGDYGSSEAVRKSNGGGIVFDTSTKIIYAGGQAYGGNITDVTFDTSTKLLTITKAVGNAVTLDFSDAASETSVFNVFKHLNEEIGLTDGNVVYTDTYSLYDASTLIDADKILDASIYNLANKEVSSDSSNAGVDVKLGGTVGSPTVTVVVNGGSVEENDASVVTGGTVWSAIEALDANVTSDDTAVANVKVVETNGKVTDVVVTNISAGVSFTAASGGTAANLEASVGTGAVTGADIAKIKDYADAVVSALDSSVAHNTTPVNIKVTQADGKLSALDVSIDYATVRSSKDGENDTSITVTDPSNFVKGSDISTVAAFTNTRIAEEVAKLDSTKESDDDAAVKVTVTEADGKITDVSVANVSAGVTATTTEGSTPTISATRNNGAVVGSDISTIKSYVDARSKYDIEQLDVNGYAQASYAENKFTISGIKEVDGKISSDPSTKYEIVTEGTYDPSTNKVATQTTVSNAINDLDVAEYAQATITNVDATTTVGGSIAVKGIKEENGKISVGDSSVVLTAEGGLRIYENKIGHTNSITAETTGKGSVDSSSNPSTKIVTGLTFDSNGHITGASETVITAANISNTAVTTDGSTNVQGTLQQLQNEINGIVAGTQFKGAFTSAADWDEQTATKSKVGDTWIYTGDTSSVTILHKNVEKNDLVIVSAVSNVKTPTDIVVVERSLDHAVTNTGGGVLTADKIVLGSGSDNVKTSNYGVSAIAIEGTASGVDGDILTSKAVVSSIDNRINELDASATSNDGSNIQVKVTEVDGKITGVNITTEQYANITRTAKSATNDPNYAVATDDSDKLVKASDLANLKLYADDKVALEVEKLDATVNCGDSTINNDTSSNISVKVVEADGKLSSVQATLCWEEFA